MAIVGAGNLGRALAVALRGAGYEVDLMVTRSSGRSLKVARKLGAEIGARAVAGWDGDSPADLLWLCVPDGEIARVAARLAGKGSWRGRVVLHCSGALTSEELAPLQARGAAVASVHPLMTFVKGSQPSLAGVPFAVEGDAVAVRVARRAVRDVDGRAYSIRKSDKAAYHAWATFVSPLFTALLAASERVAAVAGVSQRDARGRVVPILRQTLANYARLGAAGAFSGPIVRGDVDTIRRHLRALRPVPRAREVYVALARAALATLPTRNQRALKRTLDSESPHRQ